MDWLGIPNPAIDYEKCKGRVSDYQDSKFSSTHGFADPGSLLSVHRLLSSW